MLSHRIVNLLHRQVSSVSTDGSFGLLRESLSRRLRPIADVRLALSLSDQANIQKLGRRRTFWRYGFGHCQRVGIPTSNADERLLCYRSHMGLPSSFVHIPKTSNEELDRYYYTVYIYFLAI